MKFIGLLVFTAGAVTLGVELSAARLLDPWFGNSQIVWAGLIGLILLYLAVGAWLGGRLADRYPRLESLLSLASLAAVGVALIPSISPPILRLAAQGLSSYAPGLLAGTLLAVLLLFSLPVILLGAVTPWAVRLTVTRLESTGEVAGRLYALGTLGSIVGTFLPVLWLIPAYGTRWSFYLLALALLLVCLVGSLLYGRGLLGLPLLALAIVVILALATSAAGVRGMGEDEGAGTLIYEDESLYNYIAVRAWGSERHLKLNEGVGIHSVYHPDSLLSQGIWDYFTLAPLFQPGWDVQSEQPAPEVLVIGLAAGTVPQLLTSIYGPWPITGVELDPQIIEVGRRYFAMEQPNLTPIPADGRRWLQQQPENRRFDLILVDAYRPPYIPFHLTTQEFFDLTRRHLSPQGVLAVNVGRTSTNFALVDALSATLGTLFPSVYVIDEPGPSDQLGNSLVVATAQPFAPADFHRAVAGLPAKMPAEFRAFAADAAGRVRRAESPAGTPIFTDDRAPVERLVHGIILDFLQGEQRD